MVKESRSLETFSEKNEAKVLASEVPEEEVGRCLCCFLLSILLTTFQRCLEECELASMRLEKYSFLAEQMSL